MVKHIDSLEVGDKVLMLFNDGTTILTKVVQYAEDEHVLFYDMSDGQVLGSGFDANDIANILNSDILEEDNDIMGYEICKGDK